MYTVRLDIDGDDWRVSDRDLFSEERHKHTCHDIPCHGRRCLSLIITALKTRLTLLTDQPARRWSISRHQKTSVVESRRWGLGRSLAPWSDENDGDYEKLCRAPRQFSVVNSHQSSLRPNYTWVNRWVLLLLLSQLGN